MFKEETIMVKTSLQLYSLKNEIPKDFLGTLEKVAQMGYDGVEFAGFFDTPADVLRAKLDELGLEAQGAHMALGAVEDDIDGVIAYNKTIGNKYIVVPFCGCKTKEEFESFAKRLQTAGRKLKENGITLGFHNHAVELEYEEDGKYGFDILVGDELIYEPDVFWTDFAGIDTVAFLKKIGTRAPLIHLKDYKIQEDKSFKDVAFGVGDLDHKKIVDTALEFNKPEWLIIEWEGFDDGNGLEAVKVSLDNLKKLL